MAQPAGTHSSYDAVGNREDLVDAIYMLDTSDTPVMSAAGKVDATSTKHEWQEDSLATAADQESTPNAVIEGDDTTSDTSAATTRLFNYTQLMDKEPRITSTQEAVNSAGRDSEMARQLMKRGKELKQDIEKALLANNAYVAGNDTTAREMAGFLNYQANNINKASDATAPTGDGTDAWTFGTARALTESQLKDGIKQAWDDGGSPTMIIAGSFNRQKISGFSGGNTLTQNAGEKRLTATVRIYESDYGDLVVQADRYARTNCLYILDPEYISLAVLQDFDTFDKAKTGHSDAKNLHWEGTLEVRNRKAHAVITDLTDS